MSNEPNRKDAESALRKGFKGSKMSDYENTLLEMDEKGRIEIFNAKHNLDLTISNLDEKLS